jgi:copper(I)-binding protein
MDLFNPGNVAETIVQVETAVARTAQIHSTINVDGMLKMRSAMPLTIGAGQGVSLAPAGMHMMLMGLSQPLVVDSSFNVTLVLQSGEALTVEVKVGSPGQLVAP